MTVTLAIDTATSSISAAIARCDQPTPPELATDTWHAGNCEILAEVTQISGRSTAALMIPSVEALLGQAGVSRSQLTSIAVGLGPGPFTSLRVGVMFAKAMGWALGIPVVGACSLDVIARTVPWVDDASQEYLIGMDARRREVYWAKYRAGIRIHGPAVAPAAQAEAANPGTPWWQPPLATIPAAATLAQWVVQTPQQDLLTICQNVVSMRQWAEPDQDGAAIGATLTQTLHFPEPLYLRRADATPPPEVSLVVPSAKPST